MRLINISEYDYDTMQLAKPIYDAHKRVLLAAGRHIHPKFMDRLKQMDISFMFVDDNISRGISLEEMLDMPTWMDTIQTVKAAYLEAEGNQILNVVPIQKAIGKLILEVEKRPVIVLVPTSTISAELTPYAHAVNVTLLSLQIGKLMQLNKIQLRDLGIGSLLHDIGKVKTDKREKHPEEGFNILRNARELNVICSHVAFQHHEALDGSGFPRGISGDDFHLFGQICGIANTYENMISNQGISPNEAMERLMTISDRVYKQQVVHALVQGVPAFPPGTKVKLSTGDEAIVIRIESHMQRPVVRLIRNEQEISLEENPTIMISNT